jgi:hypothetical protein
MNAAVAYLYDKAEISPLHKTIRFATGEVKRQSRLCHIPSAAIQVSPSFQRQRSETIRDLFSEVSRIPGVFSYDLTGWRLNSVFSGEDAN